MKIKIFQNLILILLITIGCSKNSRKAEEKSVDLEFDIKQTTYSIPKSNFSVGNTARTKGLVLTDIKYAKFAKKNIIFRFLSVSGSDTIVPDAIGTPGMITLFSNDHLIGKACFESPKKFRLIGKDSLMVLLSDSSIIADHRLNIERLNDTTFNIINRNEFGTSRHVLTCLKGIIDYHESRGQFTLKPNKNNSFEICIEE